MTTEIGLVINANDKSGPAFKSTESNIKSLSNQAESAGGKLSAMGVAVGTALGTVAGAGINTLIGKLTDLVGSVGSTGIGFNSMREQSQLAFETMLGSGAKAKVFLDDLQQFAAKTPFEFPDLITASQRLLAMGFAATDVKPTLTAVGDAVAGLGGNSALVDRVTTALGQMQAKGKASGEEMMQLTEAGIPAWEFLAKAIGTNVADAMDKVSKGTVSADVAIAALVDGMNTKFGGLMAKQSATFGGLLSTAKDTFAQVSGTVMQPLFEQMSRGLSMIVDWTSSPAFTDGVKSLTDWMGKLGMVAGNFFDLVASGQPVFTSFYVAIGNMLPPSLLPIWTGLYDIITTVTRVTKSLFTEVKRFEDDSPMTGYLLDLGDMARGTFKALFDQAGKVIAQFWDWATRVTPPLIEGIAKFFDHLGMITDAVKTVFKPVGDAITKFIKFDDVMAALGILLSGPVLSAIGGVIAILGAPIITQIVALTAAVAALRYAWQNDIGGIQTFTKNAVQKISDWFFKESGIWKGTWEDTWVFVADRVRYFFQIAIPSFIKGNLANIREDIRFWTVKTRDLFVDWGTKAYDTVAAWATNTINTVTNWKDRVIGFFQKTFGPIIKEIDDWAGVTQSKINIWVGWQIRYFTEWKEGVIEKWEALVTWWQTFVDPWIQRGKDWIQGLWDGVEERWNAFNIWWKGIWQGAVDWVKDLLGISSPSKLFASYGRFIMEGLAGGIAEYKSRVDAEIDSVTNSLTSKMERLKGAMVQSAFDLAAALKAVNPNNLPVIGVIPGTNGGTALLGPAPSAGGGAGNASTPPATPITTIGNALGGTSTTGTAQSLLGGITLATPDIQGAINSAKAATGTVKDFIGGLSDFLAATVDNRQMSKVFQTLDSNLTGIVELREADGKMRTMMADLLGVSSLYGRLTDSLGMVMEKITAGTDLSKVASLLQSAVDFRTLANHYSTSDYANVLPTDKRLIGGNETTTNFNITLQGSNNASADVLGLVQLLGSLQGSATP